MVKTTLEERIMFDIVLLQYRNLSEKDRERTIIRLENRIKTLLENSNFQERERLRKWIIMILEKFGFKEEVSVPPSPRPYIG